MDIIKIHVLHCGQMKTIRWLPFNKDQVSMAKVAGLFVPEKDWEWLLVACYYMFAYDGKEGPFGRSFDLFGDGSVQLINIPGHCAGLSAVKITEKDGKYVLLDADGAYSAKNWEEMVPSGIAANRKNQMKSLEWIREMSMNENCIESLATHDPNVKPHVVEIALL